MEDFRDISLTLEQRTKLEKALLSAFTADSMAQMLRLKLGYKIEEEVNTQRGFKYVVTDLVNTIESIGKLGAFLLAAKSYNPGNMLLNGIVAELEVMPREAIEKENIEFKPDAQDMRTRLEKIARKRAPFIPFNTYMTGLSSIGAQIARVEIPDGTEAGTAWLVAPDLVLTAYHVIESVHNGVNNYNHHDLLFRFDYTDINSPSRTAKVNGDWLIDSSPYSQHDLEATQHVPAADELDYALIRLAEKVGDDDLPGGRKRGWIVVHEQAIPLAPEDFVMIPQHPNGRPLELAFGELLKYNKSYNRVQYDTNTEHGSSGSPCFNISLQSFALHHAQGPKQNLKYNQGVPLREIIKLMKSRHVTPFWK